MISPPCCVSSWSRNDAHWKGCLVTGLSQVPRRAPHVVSRRLGTEAVLLNTQTEAFFTLNAVGASVWNLIDGQRTVAMLVQDLLQTFDVSEAQLTEDVTDLLQDLVAQQLIALTGDRQ
jgi:hypothetical protein